MQPKNYIVLDFYINDLNLTEITKGPDTLRVYNFSFIEPTTGNEHNVLIYPNSDKLKQLSQAVFGMDSIFDMEYFVGRLVKGTLFYNTEQGFTTTNVAYFKVPDENQMVYDFYALPSPDFTTEDIHRYLDRWAYEQYVRETYQRELPEWIVKKSKLHDSHDIIREIWEERNQQS